MFKVFEMPFPTAVLWEKNLLGKTISEYQSGPCCCPLKVDAFLHTALKGYGLGTLGGLRSKGYCRELRLVLRGEGKKYGKESGVGQLFTGNSDGRTTPLPGCNQEPWAGLRNEDTGTAGPDSVRTSQMPETMLLASMLLWNVGNQMGKSLFTGKHFSPLGHGGRVLLSGNSEIKCVLFYNEETEAQGVTGTG